MNCEPLKIVVEEDFVRALFTEGKAQLGRTVVNEASIWSAVPEEFSPPLNTVHRSVIMAVERGKLQYLIFDNHVLWNYRAIAAVLGAILRLGPVKRTMASDHVKSRYLEALALRFS